MDTPLKIPPRGPDGKNDILTDTEVTGSGDPGGGGIVGQTIPPNATSTHILDPTKHQASGRGGSAIEGTTQCVGVPRPANLRLDSNSVVSATNKQTRSPREAP